MDKKNEKSEKNLTSNSPKKSTSKKVQKKGQKSEVRDPPKLRNSGSEKTARLRRVIPQYLQISTDDRLFLRSSQVCKLFDISDRTLSTWTARGAPQYKRGWWDLAALIDWRIKEAGLGEEDGGTTNEAKRLNADARLKEVKADIEEMRLERMLERFIPVELVEEELSSCFANARSAMLRIGEKVFTELYSQYPEITNDVRRIINYEIENALQRLAEFKLDK